MLHYRAAEDILPYCLDNEIAVVPYSPLAKGLLTGKFKAEDTFEDVRAHDPEFLGDRFLRNLKLVAALKDMAERYDKTVAQLVINWTASFPGITSPIVGAKRPSQVIENAGGIGWALLDEDLQRIDQLLEEHRRAG